MKQLMILRHAKAAPEDFYADDHARALNERGREAAKLLGHYLYKAQLQPATVICSTSTRTRETWQLLAAEIAPPANPILFDKTLYHASAAHLLHRVQETSDASECLLLIGHNPGMHVLALELAGAGDAALRNQLRQNFPTTAMAIVAFDVEHWAEVGAGKGTLTHFLTPKLLEAA
jgi:phosphohistidine phosphatase